MPGNFQEYPKRMSHPQHQDAIWRQLEGKGKGLFAPDTICTSPERFPEVTVFTIDQEKSYAAKGYRPNNVPDLDAYEQAILDSYPAAGFVQQDYPRWMYHVTEIPALVQNATEEKALGSDWSRSPIIATDDDLPADDDAVRVKHEAKIDKRTKAHRQAVGA